jgi:hypothetical protein
MNIRAQTVARRCEIFIPETLQRVRAFSGSAVGIPIAGKVA